MEYKVTYTYTADYQDATVEEETEVRETETANLYEVLNQLLFENWGNGRFITAFTYIGAKMHKDGWDTIYEVKE